MSDRAVGLVVIDEALSISSSTPPGAAGMCGVASLGPSRVALADTAAGVVRLGDLATNTWTAGPADPTALGRPTGVWPAADGGLLVVDAGGRRLLHLDATLAAPSVIAPLAAMRAATSVAVARDGRTWLVDQLDGLFVLDALDQPVAVPLLPFGDGTVQPQPVHVAPGVGDGVIVTDLAGQRLLLVDAGGEANPIPIDPATSPGGVGLLAPMAAVVEERAPDVFVVVLDVGTNRVLRFMAAADDTWTFVEDVPGETAQGSRRFTRAVSMAMEVTL